MWPCLCLKSGSHFRDLQRVCSPLFTLKPSFPPGMWTSLRTVPRLFHNVKSSPFLKSFHFKKPFSNGLLKYLPLHSHLADVRIHSGFEWVCFSVSQRHLDTHCYKVLYQTCGPENVLDMSDQMKLQRLLLNSSPDTFLIFLGFFRVFRIIQCNKWCLNIFIYKGLIFIFI